MTLIETYEFEKFSKLHILVKVYSAMEQFLPQYKLIIKFFPEEDIVTVWRDRPVLRHKDILEIIEMAKKEIEEENTNDQRTE